VSSWGCTAGKSIFCLFVVFLVLVVVLVVVVVVVVAVVVVVVLVVVVAITAYCCSLPMCYGTRPSLHAYVVLSENCCD